MKFIYFIIFLVSFLYATSENNDEILADREAKIAKNLELIDSSRQELEAYRAATNTLFNQREEQILAKEIDLNKTLAQISQKEENIKRMLDKNEKILSEIKSITNDKILAVYAKMKDGAAATIIAQLPRDEAAKVLHALDPKKISTIFAKMDPQIAAELTQILKNDELFKDLNSTK
ncbi:MotE family protein [Campylobacter devanensis]|uniref:MotE family protein n=1 Tax=Campylobacter devanensis TaxID=3161138 RepID=UPI000A347ECA|nr:MULTISPECIES: MotE family protein [unclassified Campylobacter]